MHFGGLIALTLRKDGFTAENLRRPEIGVINEKSLPVAGWEGAFGHARLLVPDVRKAEEALKPILLHLCQRDLVKPVVVVTMDHPFGGTATPVEIVALADALERAGARKVYLWFGRQLTEEEVREQRFPPEGVVITSADVEKMKDPRQVTS